MRNFALIFSVAVFGLSACSNMATITEAGRAPIPESQCDVTVYQTLNAAEKNGEILELCAFTGTSAPSFNHTVETAIKQHKDDACECGADNVYVESRSPMKFGPASVSLVGFIYVNRKD